MILRTLLVLFTICFALAVPKFNYITNLVGGVANNLVAIILPPLFYIALKRKTGGEVKIWMYVVNSIVIIVGILAGAATIVATITELAGVDFSIGLIIDSGENPQDCVAQAQSEYEYSPAWL